MRTRLTLVLGLFFAIPLFAQSSADIHAADIQQHIKYLASPELAGRGSGSEGNRKAAEYIADLMKRAGVMPKGDSGSYFQKFDFVADVRMGPANALTITSPVTGALQLTADKDFRPFAFSSNSSVSGPLVFLGYGLSVPDSNYDEYKDVEVQGKIVVILRYGPDGTDPRSPFSRFTSFRNKARVARDKGAVGLIIVTGPRDEAEDEIIKLSYDQSFESSGIPAVSLKREVIEKLLAAGGTSLGAIQDSLRSTRRPHAVALNATAALTTEVVKVKAQTQNVIGYLPGSVPALADQVLVLGAHFDHLGYGGRGSGSLVPDTVAIHPGADDNASGTAGLLELVDYFAGHRSTLGRSILFTFFSGEELGTLGSAHYVNHPTVPLEQSVAMLNMDMIGRLDNRVLTVYGTGTSAEFPALVQQYNKDSAFSLKLIPDGYGPSDHAQFYGKGLPVLFFFTGTHNDYHKPADTWDKINYPGEEQVVRYVQQIASALDTRAERPVYLKAASSSASSSGSGDSRSFAVTMGIIPDFGESTEGMKIGGVRPNGPAEKAGLKTGDVIVKMAGKKVMNVYDYMGLLGELKAGQVVEVEVLRAGTSVTVQATMEKRK